MKKLWMILWGCLTLFFETKAGEKTDTSRKLLPGNSLLWRISGNDMKKPSYLFGTMHLICKDDYLWTPIMKKSLRASKEVCFEMDMDDPAVLVEIATGMIDNTGKQLSEYFAEEDYALIEKHFEELGVNAAILKQLKPGALMSLLATSGFKCTNTVSYENNIMQEAKKLKMEVTGLEMPREQLALLESFPVDSIVEDLLKSIKNPATETSNEYAGLVAAYRKQNIAALYEMMNSSPETGISLDVFLTERNEKWIERMEERMDQKPVFFAVGAGHLWGEKGVLNLLREKGYKIEAVR